ncbi:MAG: Do family serine endopeptidase [Geminicoccaceae bacterium]
MLFHGFESSVPGIGLGAGWKRLSLFTVMVLVCLAGGVSVPVNAQQLPPVEGFGDLVEKVGPAVVRIAAGKQGGGPEEMPLPEFPPGSPFEEFFKDFFERDQQNQQQRPRRAMSQGSGFVIDPEGYVVTNNHVVADADEITVIFQDDHEFTAELIGRDPKTDLALLKIASDTGAPFPSVEWADSDQVRVGDWMVAIGNPFGLGFSVTAGIVSARGRDIRAGPYDDFFQVDAAINRGNSGGPSFTLDGKVFGVNTAIFSPSGGNVGIGFAIPSNLARNIITNLKSDGRVARGWLGVRIQNVTSELAEGLGLETVAGALVASVTAGGPAAEADIVAGDVILRFDGKTIDQMRSLPRIVAETEIGKEVNVEVWRRGEQLSVSVVLGELPDDEELAQLDQSEVEGAPRSTADITLLGITISALDEELRAQYGIEPDAAGVVIISVEPGSYAEEESLQPGDLITEVNQEEVASPPEVMARVNQAESEGKKSVLLLVNRQGDLRFIAIKIAD